VTIAFQGIGLFTLFVGFTMAMKTTHFLVLIFSIVLGGICGELIDIDKHLNRFGEWLRTKLERMDTHHKDTKTQSGQKPESQSDPLNPGASVVSAPTSERSRFAEGLVTAFLLFCMGSMTVLGAIEEGLGGKPNLLVAKSVLDGFASTALAESLGIGVLFSIIPLIIYQGGLTLFAGSLHAVLSNTVVSEISAAGGLILIGLGINILEIKQLKVLNLLPALVFAGVLAAVFVRG
jgi:uncharacterized membrane protein YqgA involved in biofilm formation